MKRIVGLSLAAGVLLTCMAASSGQAAPVSGAIANPPAQSSGVVSQVYWRHRHHAARGTMIIATVGDAKAPNREVLISLD